MDLLFTDNDLQLVNGDIAFADEETEIGQRIGLRLTTFRGEYFLNRNYGVPYYTQVFGKGIDIDTVKSLLTNSVLEVDGVRSLKDPIELNYIPTTRELQARVRVNTVAGEVDTTFTQVQ